MVSAAGSNIEMANLVCLQIHNDYLIPGGETKSAILIGDLLEKKGIKVIRYYVNNRELENASLYKKIRIGLRSIYSKKTVEIIDDILEKEKVDFAIIHNTTPIISNSIFAVLSKHGVPMYKYLQNYNLICLNGAMDHSNICNGCRLHPIKGVYNKCYKSSCIYSMQKYISNKILWRRYLDKIDGFIAISEYVKRKHVDAGLPKKKTHVLYHFCERKPCIMSSASNITYFVYMGRLSKEKGIMTLLNAMKQIPTVELKIIGKGDMEEEILHFINDNDIKNVQLIGYKQGEEKDIIVGNALALIAPSEWEEPFGRIAIEAYQVGTPVIASNVGGLKELILEGTTGYLFESGNSYKLVEAMQKILNLSVSAHAQMRENCIRTVDAKFSEETYFKKLTQITLSKLSIKE